MEIGETDEHGNEVINTRGDATLYKTLKGEYLVYLWLSKKYNLHAYRKSYQTACELFDLAGSIQVN